MKYVDPILFIHGDSVVITDPEIVLAKQDRRKFHNSLRDGYLNYVYSEIGIKNFIYDCVCDEDDICWDIRKNRTNRKLGGFVVNNLLIVAMPLNEILKYNPDFDYEKAHDSGDITVIPNFEGVVYFDLFLGETRAERRIIGKGNTNFHSELHIKGRRW